MLSRFVCVCASALPVLNASAQDPVHVLDPALHHLGDSNVPSWTEVPPEPEGTRLDIRFAQRANAGEVTLELRYRDVDDPWYVRLNGTEIAELTESKVYRTRWFTIPANTLVDGNNLLTVAPSKRTDDIIVGEIRLHLRPLRQVLDLRPLAIEVREHGGPPLPARVTITTADGALAELYYAIAESTAVREGVGYTGNGILRVELPRGEYDVYATRGMEWSLAHARVDTGAVGELTLELQREVDTTGFISCDAHLHTLTYSGHGNASIEERMTTLAAEGVELAISTDHNHNTDYRPVQARLGLSEHFTAVTGNEVTTDNGHFNAFPLKAADPIPAYKLTDWVKLIDGIRAKGAKVVILNHPRWPAINDSPFSHAALDRLSGERHAGAMPFTFDAMELTNSTTKAPNPIYLFRDWFALLNHGERITAVGTSDSHTVEEPVGQGRTYLRSSTDDASRIDVDEACRAFLTGDASISVGIFCDVRVDDKPIGATVTVDDQRVGVALRVAAPGWVEPRRALVFVNGLQVAEHAIERDAPGPVDETLRFDLPTPAHDAHLVCVVLGDKIDGPFWPHLNPYSLAATNPVYLDGDGDGQWRSPRETANRLFERHGQQASALRAALASCDDAVAVQALAVARVAYGQSHPETVLDRLREIAGDRDVARDYVEALSKRAKPDKR